MRTSTQRLTRKAAIAAALLGVTLILPGSAVASHNPSNVRNPFTCDPTLPSTHPNSCPEFEAGGFVRVQNPVKNTPSAVSFEFSQNDRAMPVMKANYYLPKGWRFALSELDQSAAFNSFGAATQCVQQHNTSDNGSLVNAEGLSADTGMLLQRESQRNDNPTDQQELNAGLQGRDPRGPNAAPTEYGYKARESSNTSGAFRNPSVSFMSWDGTTARLCYHHRSNASGAPGPSFYQEARLTRLAGDPDFDWRLSIDLASLYANTAVRSQQGTILRHTIGLNSITGGNWNRHPVTNELQKVTFSRTPIDPAVYPFRVETFACAGAMDPVNPTGCAGGTYTAPIVVNQNIHIAPSPDKVRHDFARLTNPATTFLQEVQGFRATWNQPAVVPGVEVMGYALVVAHPNSQKSRKFYRLITDDTNPDFNATVCGPTGDDAGCSFFVELNIQSTDGSTLLLPNTGYHYTLITIYKQDGRRTDGRCDGGPLDEGTGVTCPDNVVPLRANTACTGSGCAQADKDNLQEPGIDSRRVLIRPDTWPNVYGGSPTWLLLDFSRKRAEYIEWPTGGPGDPSKGPPTIRAAVSNLIIGDDASGIGVFEFGSATLAGSTQNWLIAGVADPLGGAIVAARASYDAKNPTVSSLPTILSGDAIAGWPQHSISGPTRMGGA